MDKPNDDNKIYLCRRCGKRLTSEQSRADGMGKKCKAKWIKEHGHKSLFSIPPKDAV